MSVRPRYSSSAGNLETGMPTKILWFLIYFVATEGFGLRSESWGGLGKVGLGWFGSLQVLVAILSVLAIVPGMNYLFGNSETRIGSAVLMIGLLPAYMILVSVARSAIGPNVGFGEMIQNLLQLKNFLLLYLFSYLMSRRSGFENAMQAMALYALVNAVSILVIIAFDMETSVSVTSTSNDVTRLFRVIFPGALLVAAGWLFFLSRYLILGGISNGLASGLCLAATVIQLHRSTLLAVTITILISAYWLFTSSGVTTAIRKWAIGGAFTVITISTALTIASSGGIAMDYVKTSVDEAIGIAGNSGLRANIILNSWSYIFSDTFGFGLGLDWDRTEDFATYIATSFTAGPTFDSSYANVIITFGLPGVVLYLWLLLQLAALTRWQNIECAEPRDRIFAIFLRSFLVFGMIIGIGSDFVLLSSGTATFMLVIVASVQLKKRQFLKGSLT